MHLLEVTISIRRIADPFTKKLYIRPFSPATVTRDSTI